MMSIPDRVIAEAAAALSLYTRGSQVAWQEDMQAMREAVAPVFAEWAETLES